MNCFSFFKQGKGVVKSMAKKRARYGFLFVLPYIIVFLIFQLYPIIYTFFLSMEDGATAGFIGLKNYQRLAVAEVFWKSVGNTWIIWLGCIIPQIISALVLAVLLCQYKLKGANVFQAMFYLPNLVTAASIGILFSVLLDWQTGTVNKILLSMNLINEPVKWMGNPVFARGLTSLIQWWMWFGHSTIILTAGIKAISTDVIEAAVVDGSNSRQRFFYITMPLIRPTLLYVAVTSLIGGMQIFDIPMALTGGTGEPQKSLMTMVLYLYNTAFKNKNYAYGATVSYGLFIIILIVSVLLFQSSQP